MNNIEQARQLEHIRKLYQLINGNRSLVRSNFNRLKPGQKRLLLAASGIQPRSMIIYNSNSQFSYTFGMNFDDLTDKELDDLSKGLRRLQAIIDIFSHCEQQDFIKQ